MNTEPLAFSDSPETFIWFYAYLPILIASMLFPIVLYFQTRSLPWLIMALAQIAPYYFLISALFASTWDMKLYPVKCIDAAGNGTINTYTNWSGLIMIFAFMWFYIENKKRKSNQTVEPSGLKKYQPSTETMR